MRGAGLDGVLLGREAEGIRGSAVLGGVGEGEKRGDDWNGKEPKEWDSAGKKGGKVETVWK